jgi:hypothetical protein
LSIFRRNLKRNGRVAKTSAKYPLHKGHFLDWTDHPVQYFWQNMAIRKMLTFWSWLIVLLTGASHFISTRNSWSDWPGDESHSKLQWVNGCSNPHERQWLANKPQHLHTVVPQNKSLEQATRQYVRSKICLTRCPQICAWPVKCQELRTSTDRSQNFNGQNVATGGFMKERIWNYTRKHGLWAKHEKIGWIRDMPETIMTNLWENSQVRWTATTISPRMVEFSWPEPHK